MDTKTIDVTVELVMTLKELIAAVVQLGAEARRNGQMIDDVLLVQHAILKQLLRGQDERTKKTSL